MTWHTMVLSEDHPTKTGFIYRYFANIDVTLSESDWYWQQVDLRGNNVGNVMGPFATENDAKNAALNSLHGDEWEQ